MHLSECMYLMHLEDKEERLKGSSVALQDPHQNALAVVSLAIFPASALQRRDHSRK